MSFNQTAANDSTTPVQQLLDGLTRRTNLLFLEYWVGLHMYWLSKESKDNPFRYKPIYALPLY